MSAVIAGTSVDEVEVLVAAMFLEWQEMPFLEKEIQGFYDLLLWYNEISLECKKISCVIDSLGKGLYLYKGRTPNEIRSRTSYIIILGNSRSYPKHIVVILLDP